jgi:hypothetical protein
MKLFSLIALLLCVTIFQSSAQAEGGTCPNGYYPLNGSGVSGCAPIPGYGQPQSRVPATPPVRWESRWGAIATDGVLGVLGASTGMTSERRAKKAAISDCQNKGGTSCKFQVSFANGCGVMVVDDEGFIVSKGPTLDSTTQHGMKACQDAGANHCRVYYSICSSAQRVQ